jgi:hypothetical protein
LLDSAVFPVMKAVLKRFTEGDQLVGRGRGGGRKEIITKKAAADFGRRFI